MSLIKTLKPLPGELFLKKPKQISRHTCEGNVYKISNLRVKKVWNTWNGSDCSSNKRWEILVKRFKNIDEKYKHCLAIPKYYGHQRIKGFCNFFEIVTYHQYIPTACERDIILAKTQFSESFLENMLQYCSSLGLGDLDPFDECFDECKVRNQKYYKGVFYVLDPLLD